MDLSQDRLILQLLVEGLELLIRKVAYTKYDATGLVRWSSYRTPWTNDQPVARRYLHRTTQTQNKRKHPCL
jgi:hypothetical protein